METAFWNSTISPNKMASVEISQQKLSHPAPGKVIYQSVPEASRGSLKAQWLQQVYTAHLQTLTHLIPGVNSQRESHLLY